MVGNDGGNCGMMEIFVLLLKVALLMMLIVMVIAMVIPLHIRCSQERFSVEC